VGVEEERQPRRERVHVQALVDGRLDVGDPVGQGEGDFLHCGGAGFADVVPADGYGVPLRHVPGAELEDIGDEAQRRPRRVDVGAAGDVLLEDVVLHGAGQLVGADALPLAHGDVHGQEHAGGGVDGHGSGHLVQGDLVEQRGHVLHRVDGDAHLAHFALGQCVVGVQADLGGQVERDTETRLTLLQEVAVPLVALLGGGVTGVLAHGPETLPVHSGVDPAGVGVAARVVELRRVVEAGQIVRAIRLLNVDSGSRPLGCIGHGSLLRARWQKEIIMQVV